ncbi:hypothetical protein Acid345_0252 [Candidatus Koribacter versatilis Ellin345]|uniref:Uncharacterized protein n=1 Tax=Koribacter versatilis (strain Ellin345) TaxID=204669 RepID=Q1IV43_KORVE|nr:hypothetical protein [Candidatus Koribacter versatilis]ABF39257.1 hypothetical protein Acid345_0252 [Candidatus Koribacter versatilis Ellin345]
MVGATAQTFGNAKRLRNAHGSLNGIVTMTTVCCETCGFHYAIEHPAGAGDEALAQRQAAWLADRFVWDHIQENKHSGSVRLPLLPAPATAAAH